MATNKEIIDALLLAHFKKVKNRKVKNKKIIVCFAGIPGTGKTYSAKILEEEFKGIRITSDKIRKVIKYLAETEYPELKEEQRREEILKEYVYFLLIEQPFENNLILVDSGIERKYSEIAEIAKKKKFPLIVLNLEVSRGKATERAITRAGGEDEHFKKNIDRWIKEHEEFIKNNKVDLTFNTSSGLDKKEFLDKFGKLMNSKAHISNKHKV